MERLIKLIERTNVGRTYMLISSWRSSSENNKQTTAAQKKKVPARSEGKPSNKLMVKVPGRKESWEETLSPGHTHPHRHSHPHSHRLTSIFNWTSACNWPKLWWNCAKGALWVSAFLDSKVGSRRRSRKKRKQTQSAGKGPFQWTQH